MKPNRAFVVAAKRTPVGVRNGALQCYEVWRLGARVIDEVLRQCALPKDKVDSVVMGNALYAGGNPARLAALEAGLPERVPALTLDTQCCSGLDAIATAARTVSCGEANVVIAGGLESYSRAPLRYHRTPNGEQSPTRYERPPFTPWSNRDPDMIAAAASLAQVRKISREQQAQFAVASHTKAMANSNLGNELVAIGDSNRDSFTRKLTAKICSRAPIIAGDSETGLTNATVAVEADAAAAVVIVSEGVLSLMPDSVVPILCIEGCAVGYDPRMPALAPIAAINATMQKHGVGPQNLKVVELMEAFAVQAMVCVEDCLLPSQALNRGGGALARGHPVGASGAILAVRLWSEMQREKDGSYGLAAIAAAGGLGSALLWQVTR